LRIFNAESEIKAIISILVCDRDIQGTFISKLSKDHFAFDQMHLCFELISKAVATDNVPSLDIFLQNPQLTQESKDILQNPSTGPIGTIDDAEELIKVLEYWRKIRGCYQLALTLSGKLKSETPPDMTDLIGEIEKSLSNLRTSEDSKKTWHIGMGHNSEELIENMLNEEKPKLIASTFNNFDSKVGGFGSQDLVILASHAKGGKSIVALNMLINMYLHQNLNVIMFSLEMRAWEVQERIMSCLTGIEHSSFRQKQLHPHEKTKARLKWDEFRNHGEKANCRFTLKDTTSLSVPEFKLEVKNRGYQVACIDYINLMSLPGQKANTQDWERISILGKELKQATKECDMLIMAPTQMNDDGGLRYSKALLEHANTVWRWHSNDEQTRISHQIKVIQQVVRGWAPFPFMMREDFERCQVFDGSLVVPEADPAQSKQKRKSMYED
jgi:replicative DNA helicase